LSNVSKERRGLEGRKKSGVDVDIGIIEAL
jgi:hypothetical protein